MSRMIVSWATLKVIIAVRRPAEKKNYLTLRCERHRVYIPTIQNTVNTQTHPLSLIQNYIFINF